MAMRAPDHCASTLNPEFSEYYHGILKMSYKKVREPPLELEQNIKHDFTNLVIWHQSFLNI